MHIKKKKSPLSSTPALEHKLFQITLGCKINAIFAIKLLAATAEDAEKQAREAAEKYCTVSDPPDDDYAVTVDGAGKPVQQYKSIFEPKCAVAKMLDVCPVPGDSLFPLRKMDCGTHLHQKRGAA
jgi:hypothetical protein